MLEVGGTDLAGGCGGRGLKCLKLNLVLLLGSEHYLAECAGTHAHAGPRLAGKAAGRELRKGGMIAKSVGRKRAHTCDVGRCAYPHG